MKDFQEKVALVTGAGRGLGRTIAQAFARSGAKVAANDLTPDNLDKTVESIEAEGGVAVSVIADVTRKNPVQVMIEQVRDTFGTIDFLINNARVKPSFSLLEMDEWDWDRTIDVNLKGPFLLMQSVSRVMQQEGGGTIVNIVRDIEDERGMSQFAAYLASGEGLLGLTKTAAIELAAYNIRVNAVCPVSFDTPSIVEGSMESKTPDSRLDVTGGYDDITSLILFLCSPEADFITGQSIRVRGDRRVT